MKKSLTSGKKSLSSSKKPLSSSKKPLSNGKNSAIWKAPGWAFVPTIGGPNLKVWISHISSCGKYAIVSPTKTCPKHSVLTEHLRIK